MESGLRWSVSDFQRRRPYFALILVYLLVLSPIFIIAIHSYRSTNKELTELALSRRHTVAYLTAFTVRERFDRLVDVSIALSSRIPLRELAREQKWEEAVRSLEDVPVHFPYIERMFLTDLNGTLMADAPHLPDVIGKTFAFRDWYKGVTKEWKPYVSNVYERTAKPSYNVIAVAAPIPGSTAQKPIGILVLQIKLDVLLDWIRDVETGTEGFAYLVDREGNLAAHPQFSPQEQIHDFSTVPFVGEVLSGRSGVTVVSKPSGEENVVAYMPVFRYRWGVIAEQPVSAAFAGRNSQLQKILIAYGLLCLFGAMLTLLLLIAIVRSKRAERQIRQLNEELQLRALQLEEANKELDAFSYSVSHDLRAPLRAIDGYTRILQEDFGTQIPAEAQQQLRKVSRNAQQMGDLIRDLLSFSRLSRQPLKAEPVDIMDLVKSAWKELPLQNKEYQLVLSKLPQAQGDPALIKQVILNLLSNAVKFSNKQDAPRIEVGYVNADQNAYYVRDNGAGFDMKYAHKLFGVFQRLHRAEDFEGTGVGLAIVQRILHRHGGKIWAEAEKDQGATFYFTLG